MGQPTPDTGGEIRRIYLVGMPGVGKSTVARELAPLLRWTWLDTDTCVERRFEASVREIFERHGEEAFRETERECLEQTFAHQDIVVSCGGGAPCHFDMIDRIIAHGMVVYLSATLSTLMERLTKEDSTRPLLSDHPDKRMAELLRAREQVYLKAHHHLQTDQASVTDLVQKVVTLCKATSTS